MKKSLKQIVAEEAALERRFLDERQQDIWQQLNDKLEAVGKTGDITKFCKFIARAWDILDQAYSGPQYARLDPIRDFLREAMIFVRRLMRRELIRRALTNPTPEILQGLEDDAHKTLEAELDWEVVRRALQQGTSPFAGLTDEFRNKLVH